MCPGYTQTDRQTDRKRCIWAHRAICTGGFAQAGSKMFFYDIIQILECICQLAVHFILAYAALSSRSSGNVHNAWPCQAHQNIKKREFISVRIACLVMIDSFWIWFRIIEYPLHWQCMTKINVGQSPKCWSNLGQLRFDQHITLLTLMWLRGENHSHILVLTLWSATNIWPRFDYWYGHNITKKYPIKWLSYDHPLTKIWLINLGQSCECIRTRFRSNSSIASFLRICIWHPLL